MDKYYEEQRCVIVFSWSDEDEQRFLTHAQNAAEATEIKIITPVYVRYGARRVLGQQILASFRLHGLDLFDLLSHSKVCMAKTLLQLM